MSTSVLSKDLIRRTVAKILAAALLLGFVPSAVLQVTSASVSSEADGSGYVLADTGTTNNTVLNTTQQTGSGSCSYGNACSTAGAKCGQFECRYGTWYCPTNADWNGSSCVPWPSMTMTPTPTAAATPAQCQTGTKNPPACPGSCRPVFASGSTQCYAVDLCTNGTAPISIYSANINSYCGVSTPTPTATAGVCSGATNCDYVRQLGYTTNASEGGISHGSCIQGNSCIPYYSKKTTPTPTVTPTATPTGIVVCPYNQYYEPYWKKCMPYPTATPTVAPTPTPSSCPSGTYREWWTGKCVPYPNPSIPPYSTPTPTYTPTPTVCPYNQYWEPYWNKCMPYPTATPTPTSTYCPSGYWDWWTNKCKPTPTPTVTPTACPYGQYWEPYWNKCMPYPTATPTTTPANRTDLEITKSDYRTTAKSGETITYFLTVTNHGPSNAYGATISDTLPTAFEPSSVIWTCDNCSTTYGQGSLSVSTSANILASQTLTVLVTARIRSNFTGNIVNIGYVSAPSNLTDSNPNNNAYRDDTLVSSNNTPTPTYCPYGQYWDGYYGRCMPSTTPTPTATYCPYGHTWDSWWKKCMPPSPTPTSCPSGYSWNWWNNRCEPYSTPTPTWSPNTLDLDITKTDNLSTIQAGNYVSYTITVRNYGSIAANPAYIHDAVPSQINASTIKWTCSGCTTTSGSGQSYVATTAYIPANGIVTLYVSGQVNSYATGTIENTAYVDPASNVTDTNPNNNGYKDVTNIVGTYPTYTPTPTYCPYGQTWDDWWKYCRPTYTPTPTYCPYGQYWDGYYGRCMPSTTPTPTATYCPYGYSWDWWTQSCKPNYATPTPTYGYCTADTMRCSDGSYVGRNPNNNCNFYSCPNTYSGQQLGIAKAASSVNNVGDGSYQTTYTITVANLSGNTITNLQIYDDLKNTFPSPATFSVSNISGSGNLSVNGSYTGSGNTSLLNSTSSLAPYSTSTVTFTVRIWPNQYGTYNYNYNSNFYQTYSNNAQVQGYNGGQYISDWSVNGYNVDPDGNGNPTDNASATVITVSGSGSMNYCSNNLCSNIQITVPANATCSRYSVCSTGSSYSYGSNVQCDNSSACVEFTCNSGYRRLGNRCIRDNANSGNYPNHNNNSKGNYPSWGGFGQTIYILIFNGGALPVIQNSNQLNNILVPAVHAQTYQPSATYVTPNKLPTTGALASGMMVSGMAFLGVVAKRSAEKRLKKTDA